MATWCLQHKEHAHLRFKVLGIDRAAQRATLIGPTGVAFERSIAQADLDKYGYTVVKVDDEQTNAIVAEVEDEAACV